MKSRFNRRDFLKLAGALPLGLFTSKLDKHFSLQSDKKNVVIVVFDAFSAYNMSLYGYPRETTPNITRLAERATVYHNHYATSNFTTPGTASLLTGTLPWTHRALQPNGVVLNEYVNQNIFTLFDDYYRIAYSHNEWVNTLFDQFKSSIEEWIPREQLTLFSSDRLFQKIFPNDRDIASVGWVRNIKVQQEGYAYSLFLSRLISSIEEKYTDEYKLQFPRGLPTARADGGFLLEQAVDWIVGRIRSAPGPVFGYFHFLPPHDPYRTHMEFTGQFRNDGYQSIDKPLDVFAKDQNDDAYTLRQYYDEFILYVDREFGRMFDLLEAAGQLENTILVLTSDHGEMFERGTAGHVTDSLYEPLVRIPMIIFEPGVTNRKNVYEPTSAVDLVPTLAYLSGHQVPQWTEDVLLPPYQQSDALRSVYAVRSYNAESARPLSQASMILVKDRYKLHYYFGYPELDGKELVKLFDVESDPEEMNDLSQVEKDVVSGMLSELKLKLQEVNKPYSSLNSAG
jgi:arylsulfatase A-like enzyme